MVRFFDLLHRNCNKSSRKLILSDMGIGDYSAKIIAKVIRNNNNFSILVTFFI